MNMTILTNIQTQPSEWLRPFLIVIFLIIVLIGLSGNGLVLLSVMTNHIKIRRSSTNLLLVNMSCADLIILIFNIFDIVQFTFDPFWPTAWYLGLSLCKIVRFAQVLGCYVSVQTLLVISIERYISIVYPIKVTPIHRRKRLYLLFVFIWSSGFIIAFPNLYLLKLNPFHNRPEYYICGLSDHGTDSHFITFYKYAESVCFFFLPALIQTILYMIICHKIFLVERAAQAHCHELQLQKCIISESGHQYSATKLSSSLPSPLKISSSTMTIPRSHPHVVTSIKNHGNIARKKAVIMLVIVAIFYFIAFSPSQVNFIYTQINHSHHLYEHRPFFIITILLTLSSTAFNPILFYIFSKFFRCKFNIILRRICPWCRPSIRHSNNVPMI